MESLALPDPRKILFPRNMIGLEKRTVHPSGNGSEEKPGTPGGLFQKPAW